MNRAIPFHTFFRVLHERYARHPKAVAFLCLLVFLGSILEIVCSSYFGVLPPSESFTLDFHTFWSNLPNSTTIRIDENNREFTYCYNAQGFRRSDPSILISPQKKPGTYRIITMGDSTTNGHNVPFDCSYPEILRRRFLDRAEIFSSGVPGFTALQCRLQLQHKILAYRPDLITVAVNYNDRRAVFDPRQVDSEALFYYSSRLRWITEGLAHHFAAINALLQYKIRRLENSLQEHPPRLDQITCRVPPESFAQNLETICAIAQQNHIQVIMLGLGDSFQHFDKIFAYRTADSFDEKVKCLQQQREKKEFYTYALATLLLADLLKREGTGDTGIDPQQILSSYKTVVTALGGFLIHPDWEYRQIMEKVAKEKQVPYFDFVDHALCIEEIKNGRTFIYQSNDPVHLNIRGHQMLADALYPILNGYVEGKK